MRLLFIGDVYGAPGIAAVQAYLKRHRDAFDFVVANGENCAGGFGITRSQFRSLRDAGVDVVTLGNHTFDQAETAELLEETPRLVRPLTYPRGTPGVGFVTLPARDGTRVTIGQVMGRIFMDPMDDPFDAADAIVEAAGPNDPVIVEVHAEATSEKRVLTYHLEGRVSAVIGSHTHVQTADEAIHQGTASITDVGMTGVEHSSIGMRFEEVHHRMRTKRPRRFKPATGTATLCAVALTLEGRRAHTIERVRWRAEEAS
ncbi:MAG: YmdB family metallophosphoesterase [Trueperaceae bacterium]|nr:MAG: YmdB family metallophosphoesterase [Trueperaceae bacterium]